MATEIPQNNGERNAGLYGMLCHLLALSWFIYPIIGNILGPLVMWVIKKDQYAFVDEQGKESLNFQISIVLYFLITGATCIGIFLWPVLWLMMVIYPIIAAVKASEGIGYHYPLTIKFF